MLLKPLNCHHLTGADTLTIWQRHLFSFTSFSNDRFSMMSASARAPSWSCLLASLQRMFTQYNIPICHIPVWRCFDWISQILTLEQVCLRYVGAEEPQPWSPGSPGVAVYRWSPRQTQHRVILSSSFSICPGFFSHHLGRRSWPQTCLASGPPLKTQRLGLHRRGFLWGEIKITLI